MSRDGLVTISDRGSSLGNLNSVHPSAGHIVQAESGRQTTEIGDDFCHHLGVDTTQSKQLDLLGACDGIAVVHIHRSIVLETARKGATSSAFEAFRSDVLHGHRRDGIDVGSLLSRLDFHFVEYMCGIENVVVMRGFHHVVDGVVLVADATEHEAADALVQRDFVMSVGISHNALVDDFPIHVHARQRGFLAVFVLLINRALNETLGKGGGGEGH